jgi:hypothetical protein
MPAAIIDGTILPGKDMDTIDLRLLNDTISIPLTAKIIAVKPEDSQENRGSDRDLGCTCDSPGFTF